MTTINFTKKSICNEADAKEFLSAMIDVLGLAFHPDTRISDYVNTATDEPTFRPVEAFDLEVMLQRCHLQLDDIYSTSIEIWESKGLTPKPKAPKKPSKAQQRLALLEAARELQGQFWDALNELEDALGIEIDQTLDLNDYDLDDLKQAAKA